MSELVMARNITFNIMYAIMTASADSLEVTLKSIRLFVLNSLLKLYDYKYLVTDIDNYKIKIGKMR